MHGCMFGALDKKSVAEARMMFLVVFSAIEKTKVEENTPIAIAVDPVPSLARTSSVERWLCFRHGSTVLIHTEYQSILL